MVATFGRRYAGREVEADTYERVLEVAIELFSEKGFAATSIRDIAERLGISKAAVYYHFKAKDQLLAALLDPMFEAVEALADQAEKTRMPPAEVLGRYLDLWLQQGRLLRILVEDPSVSLDDRLKRRGREAGGRLVRSLAGPRAGRARLVRARCALGAVREGVRAIWEAAPPPGDEAPSPVELRAIAAAATSALGDA